MEVPVYSVYKVAFCRQICITPLWEFLLKLQLQKHSTPGKDTVSSAHLSARDMTQTLPSKEERHFFLYSEKEHQCQTGSSGVLSC